MHFASDDQSTFSSSEISLEIAQDVVIVTSLKLEILLRGFK